MTANRKIQEKAGVYATGRDRKGERVTFRVGQPVRWARAHARHARLAGEGAVFKHGKVRHGRRTYRIDFYEVRMTDRHGRRLDSNRVDQVIPVPYRAHRVR